MLTDPLHLANFLSPEYIGTTPVSMLWLLPLAASISIVYKATKEEKITGAIFTKECATLFGSIILFMVLIAIALSILAWLLT